MNHYYAQNIYNKYESYFCNTNDDNRNSNFGVSMNEVPVSNEVGYIQIYLTKDLGKEVANDAVITIYVKQGENQIPVKRLVSIHNPTIIELPVANPLGTLIKGPEYYFTPYDLTIEKEGYYKITTLNIRLFPKIKTIFYYNLNRIMQGIPNHEEITNIPPHPRDILNGQFYINKI